MTRRFGRLLARGARDERGNVAIIFALTLLPMLGLVGIGIDYGRAMGAKTTLDASADAAALAAVTEAASSLASPNPAFTNNVATAIYAGQTAGANMFAVDAAKVGAVIGGTPTPNVSVNQVGQTLMAVVTYQASSPNVFGTMFRAPSIALSGSASSALTLPRYMNISVAIDVSQSMGLAATSAGMTKLQGLTPDGCAFGCHVVSQDQAGGPQPYSKTSYETIAHNNGIQLRTDVIAAATGDMINTAATLTGGNAPMISFGLYAMSGSMATVSKPSTNYAALASLAAGIDLDSSTDGRGLADDYVSTWMASLTAAVPANGPGDSASSPQQYVFIMSDGVQDVYCQNGYGQHCTQALDPATCAALKAKGVTVGVIYTTYLAMPGDPRYTALVAGFDYQIAGQMQACATSPSWYFQATQASDIQAAVNQLFSQATGHGILTR